MTDQRRSGYVLGAVAAASYGLNPLFTLPLYKAGLGVVLILVSVLLIIAGRALHLPLHWPSALHLPFVRRTK